MHRCVRREAALGLLELALAADPPAAPGLVPGDRDVDEPLEEIALLAVGRPPGELELLVRREELAAPDELDSRLEMGLHSRYSQAVATILLAGVDVFFRGKLDALLAGHHLVTSDSADSPDLVIADIARIEPEEVADAYPDVPILGYANHTDTAGLRRAHTAGFDQVVVKSALVERVGELVDELIAV
jgi:hypothetical protein